MLKFYQLFFVPNKEYGIEATKVYEFGGLLGRRNCRPRKWLQICRRVFHVLAFFCLDLGRAAHDEDRAEIFQLPQLLGLNTRHMPPHRHQQGDKPVNEYNHNEDDEGDQE